MTESNPEKFSLTSTPYADVEPSWKPLLWLVGGVAALVLLGELFLDMLIELGEFLFLALVEAPEEFLEDLLEDWLKGYDRHQADRYSEMITAFGVTPIKILTAILLLRWLWMHTHRNLFPKARAFLWRQWTAVRLAWKALFWPYKLLAGVVVLGVLAVLI